MVWLACSNALIIGATLGSIPSDREGFSVKTDKVSIRAKDRSSEKPQRAKTFRRKAKICLCGLRIVRI